jgi:hypothetical protein
MSINLRYMAFLSASLRGGSMSIMPSQLSSSLNLILKSFPRGTIAVEESRDRCRDANSGRGYDRHFSRAGEQTLYKKVDLISSLSDSFT